MTLHLYYVSDSGESLHCFLVRVNKSYVTATSDLWLFIHASNLLPPDAPPHSPTLRLETPSSRPRALKGLSLKSGCQTRPSRVRILNVTASGIMARARARERERERERERKKKSSLASCQRFKRDSRWCCAYIGAQYVRLRLPQFKRSLIKMLVYSTLVPG